MNLKLLPLLKRYWVFKQTRDALNPSGQAVHILDSGDESQEVFGKAAGVSHVSGESCLPGMSSSKWTFLNKEAIV